MGHRTGEKIVMEKDRGFLLPKPQCDKLLKETSIRMMLVRSHLHDYSDLEKQASRDILKVLCELFVSLDGLVELLGLARAGPIQMHNGEEHYVITEEEGFILQSLFLPAIMELKIRAEHYGLSLTVN